MADGIANSRASHRQKLRSQLGFDNPDNPGVTAPYLGRYLNFGLTAAELRAGHPIIGIARTGGTPRDDHGAADELLCAQRTAALQPCGDVTCIS